MNDDVTKGLEHIRSQVDQFAAGQKARLGEVSEKTIELQARLLDLEQKAARRGGGDPGGGAHDRQSPAAQIVDSLMASAGFEALGRGEAKSVAVRVPLDIMAATVITTAPLVGSERDSEILRPLERQMRIRDLVPVIPMTSGSVEYTRETAFTNNAALVSEGDLKPESGMTFDLVSATARTIAHWIPASRQVLEDRAELENYIHSRLLYGLKFKEEAQLLLGSGAGANLNGIYTQATAYNRSSGGTKRDYLRKAITQLQIAEATPSGIVLNPEDWEDVELQKDTAGQYITVETNINGREAAWRLPVVVSNSQPAANFLVGDFARGAAIRDRQEARVEVSREHSDFFTRNLVAILAEERIALTVFRPLAFVKGSFGS